MGGEWVLTHHENEIEPPFRWLSMKKSCNFLASLIACPGGLGIAWFGLGVERNDNGRDRMSIVSLEFEDRARGWKLRPTNFGPFNLLVGPSGAGKTSVLKALQSVCRAGTKNLSSASHCDWSLQISDNSNLYGWNATTQRSTIIKESIQIGDKKYIDRLPNRDVFNINGTEINLKLKTSESIVSLLEGDSVINYINSALQSLIISEPINLLKSIDMSNLKGKIDIDNLRQDTTLSLETRAYLLYRDHTEIFQNIKYLFFEIFEKISDIKIDIFDFANETNLLTISITEDNKNIFDEDISSGMLRVLSILLELALAPKGAVILIDEIENSLGVNCLPQIIDAMLERSNEVQFIITSHHPYVINNIPYEYWRLVRRKGGEVWLQDAKDIPALASLSSYHDRFLHLINAPEFEESMG
ncbi:MAG: ATP-binding protein [Magnetococcales bacterium]|nr:ATP-binding protein [Magnetococcales bacterium]